MIKVLIGRQFTFAGEPLIGLRLGVYFHVDRWLENRKPRRAYGFIFDRYNAEAIEKLKAGGENWLTRYIDSRVAPVSYITLYWGKWSRTIDLSPAKVVANTI